MANALDTYLVGELVLYNLKSREWWPCRIRELIHKKGRRGASIVSGVNITYCGYKDTQM